MKTYADSGLSLKTPPGLLMTHKLKWFFPAPMSHGYFWKQTNNREEGIYEKCLKIEFP